MIGLYLLQQKALARAEERAKRAEALLAKLRDVAADIATTQVGWRA